MQDADYKAAIILVGNSSTHRELVAMNISREWSDVIEVNHFEDWRMKSRIVLSVMEGSRRRFLQMATPQCPSFEL